MRPMRPVIEPRRSAVLAAVGLAAALTSCAKPGGPAAAAYRVYVTNERSNDLTVIAGANRQALATLPLGQRPRGLRLGPDGRTLYIALSGSPIARPGMDESKLPPPDKAADGIVAFDVLAGKAQRIIKGVSNPEQLAVSKDGRLYAADEDAGTLVVLAIAAGSIIAALRAGFSPDGRGAFVGGEVNRVIKAIDTQSLAVVRSATLVGDTLKPMGLAVSPDGKRLYVSAGRGGQVLALDAVSLAVKGVAATGGRPWGTALIPAGHLLYTPDGPATQTA